MSNTSEKTDLLCNTELFAPLKKEALEQIARFCSLFKAPKGMTIFKDGEPGDSLFIVKSGEVAVISRVHDHQEQEIARYSRLHFFGEVDMLMGLKRSAEARSAEDAEILRFPKKGKKLNDVLFSCPSTGAQLLYLFMQTVSKRIRESNLMLKENTPWVREIRAQVYSDKLTGLYNKTFLEEQLPSYLKDPGHPVSLLVMKPDNFKAINDTFGHEAGDLALVAIGEALSRYLPESVLIVRYTGNEINCVFPNTGKNEVKEIARGLRSFLNSLDLSAITQGKHFELSVSMGIAVFPEYAASSPDLIKLARELPLIGRERGGNLILFPEDK